MKMDEDDDRRMNGDYRRYNSHTTRSMGSVNEAPFQIRPSTHNISRQNPVISYHGLSPGNRPQSRGRGTRDGNRYGDQSRLMNQQSYSNQPQAPQGRYQQQRQPPPPAPPLPAMDPDYRGISSGWVPPPELQSRLIELTDRVSYTLFFPLELTNKDYMRRVLEIVAFGIRSQVVWITKQRRLPKMEGQHHGDVHYLLKQLLGNNRGDGTGHTMDRMTIQAHFVDALHVTNNQKLFASAEFILRARNELFHLQPDVSRLTDVEALFQAAGDLLECFGTSGAKALVQLKALLAQHEMHRSFKEQRMMEFGWIDQENEEEQTLLDEDDLEDDDYDEEENDDEDDSERSDADVDHFPGPSRSKKTPTPTITTTSSKKPPAPVTSSAKINTSASTSSTSADEAIAMIVQAGEYDRILSSWLVESFSVHTKLMSTLLHLTKDLETIRNLAAKNQQYDEATAITEIVNDLMNVVIPSDNLIPNEELLPQLSSQPQQQLPATNRIQQLIGMVKQVEQFVSVLRNQELACSRKLQFKEAQQLNTLADSLMMKKDQLKTQFEKCYSLNASDYLSLEKFIDDLDPNTRGKRQMKPRYQPPPAPGLTNRLSLRDQRPSLNTRVHEEEERPCKKFKNLRHYLLFMPFIRVGFTVDNFRQRMLLAASDPQEKIKLLLGILNETEGRALVVVQQKKMTSWLSETLRSKFGISAGEINGDQSAAERENAMKRFRDEKIRVLVTTDVGARGLDVPVNTQVIHFDMSTEDPSSLLSIFSMTCLGRHTSILSHWLSSRWLNASPDAAEDLLTTHFAHPTGLKTILHLFPKELTLKEVGFPLIIFPKDSQLVPLLTKQEGRTPLNSYNHRYAMYDQKQSYCYSLDDLKAAGWEAKILMGELDMKKLLESYSLKDIKDSGRYSIKEMYLLWEESQNPSTNMNFRTTRQRESFSSLGYTLHELHHDEEMSKMLTTKLIWSLFPQNEQTWNEMRALGYDLISFLISECDSYQIQELIGKAKPLPSEILPVLKVMNYTEYVANILCKYTKSITLKHLVTTGIDLQKQIPLRYVRPQNDLVTSIPKELQKQFNVKEFDDLHLPMDDFELEYLVKGFEFSFEDLLNRNYSLKKLLNLLPYRYLDDNGLSLCKKYSIPILRKIHDFTIEEILRWYLCERRNGTVFQSKRSFVVKYYVDADGKNIETNGMIAMRYHLGNSSSRWDGKEEHPIIRGLREAGFTEQEIQNTLYQ